MSTSPFFRDDTIFGVCEALGEDFGLAPNLLRASIGAGLLFSPAVTIAIYASAALLVLISRWLVPDLPNLTQTDEEAVDDLSVGDGEAEGLALAA
ncbi:MAG TPA: PspC domain-containing protein [Allosphingosinicella sp.]|nr:PspC domain-containing protein [Allosphingosinicella sp.]